jgi:hypothetical protein
LIQLLDTVPTYRTFALTLRTKPDVSGVKYWVEWSDWDGSWHTDLMDNPDQALAIAKLLIDRSLDDKIVQFKQRTEI